MSITVTRTPQEIYVEVSVLNSLPIEIIKGNVIRCRVGGIFCNDCSYSVFTSCHGRRSHDSDKIFTIIKNKYPELLL